MKNPFRVFTKWELLIWFGSAAAVTASFLLSPGNDYLTLTAALIGVTALIFVAKGMVLGQILTVVFSVFYGIVSYWLGYYGEMITYLCMTSPIAVLSVISWVRHPYQESSEVEVNRVSKRQVLVMAVLAVMVTAIFYVILGAMGNVNLIVSTVSVTTSFLASFLTFLRSPYYGIGYGANDIVLIVLWTLAAVNDI
ncbi:MAG: nicotinamide mononucleotide transporter, partial [Clostridia bacterium]|nr:nicotinamide mononucleotide transporter [Clostridia bacterium]